MKRLPIVALLLILGAAPCSIAQTVLTGPMDRTEILGRLALYYSPSYIAHLVKSRGLSFSLTTDFLDQVKQAGGAGILFDNLPHAVSPESIGSDPNSSASIEHLAQCAALIHSGDFDSADEECHAAIKETPSSPWPLLVTSAALQFVTPSPQENNWPVEVRKEETELLQEAYALMPPSRPSGSPAVTALVGGSVVTTEQANAPALLDREEDNSRFISIVELQTLSQDPAPAEPPDAPTEPVSSAIDIPSDLQARMQMEPDLASNHLTVADLYVEANDLENAKDELLEAVRLEPDCQRPHVQLALFYFAHGDLDGAIAELREVVRIAPEGITQHSALAHILASAGKIQEAIGEYKVVLASHPDNVENSDELVDLYVKQKDLTSAIAELRRSLGSAGLSTAGESDYVTFRWNDETRLGQLLEVNRDLDGAAQQYLYLLRFQPDDPNLHNEYGMLLAQQKRCADAIGEFNESIRLTTESDDSSYARSNIAQCLTEQKDYAGALRELKSILDSQPNSPIAENNVAWIYATAEDPKVKNPAEALRLARLAVDSSQQPEPSIMDTLAEALLINGKSQEALEMEKKAVSLDPDNPEYQSRLEHFEKAATQPSR
jgi:tetratricopeptide (TPR) repeat protein